MTELLTAAQMRAIEEAAIASGEVTGLELMERAGRGVVEAVFEEWPELAKAPHRAVVLCGPGNNGGDGFVVARLLKEWGWEVEVFLYGDIDRLPPDAKANHDVWCGMGEVRPLTLETAGGGDRPELLVDALFGTGLTRPIPRDVAVAFHAVRRRKTPRHPWLCKFHVVAVDCPSGLDCDTGDFLLPVPPPGEDDDEEATDWAAWWRDEAETRLLRADLTATFHAAKVGHYLDEASYWCGKLASIDIGLREDRIEPVWDAPPGDRVRLVEPRHHGSPLKGRIWLHRIVPRGHKYDRGHVLVLAGGVGRGGAARMAARGALRAGAGLVTVGCPPAALQENAAQLDAIMLRPVADAAALEEMLTDRRLSCVCLGPGLGVGERTRVLVAAACAPHPDGSEDMRRRVVLDADGLSSFADDPDALFGLLNRDCVLTPHEGEFARLFPDLSKNRRYGTRVSKVDAARAAAERAGCTVLLKGPDTVISSPGGAASIHAALYGREAPWLGTAGAGDVLAGMIAGLLASPLPWDSPHPAVEAAAWLHVEAARAFGPGLIAEDLPEALPGVFRSLGL